LGEFGYNCPIVSIKELSAAVLKLPRKSRARLAEELLDSLSPKDQRDIDADWAIEAEARLADLESGKTKAISLSTVLRRLKKWRRNEP
jgi:putative addiction module component (TIGR02574 family)